MDMEQAVRDYDDLQAAIMELQGQRDHLEYEIIQAMDKGGQTILDHPTHDVQVARKATWDKTGLYALAEEVPPDALAKAYTPAHEERVWVDDKWDMRQVKPLGKYGNAARAIIEAAEMPGVPKLSITRKKE